MNFSKDTQMVKQKALSQYQKYMKIYFSYRAGDIFESEGNFYIVQEIYDERDRENLVTAIVEKQIQM